MTAPSFFGVGAFAAGTAVTAISPAFPASTLADDIALLVVTSDGATTLSLTDAQGFQLVENTPQGSAVTVFTDARLFVWWKRLVGSDVAPTVSMPTSYSAGRIFVFRGCSTEGSPWDFTAGDALNGSTSTTGIIPGGTTQGPDRLIAAFIAGDTDTTSTAQLSGWTNADLAAFTERADNFTASGGGGGIGAATGTKAAAGVVGNSTVTFATASTQARFSIALRPHTIGAVVASLVFNGTATTLTYTRIFSADAASLVLSGTDATLLLGITYTLPTDPGSLAFTGAAAALNFHRTLIAGSTTLDLDSDSADLVYDPLEGIPWSTVQAAIHAWAVAGSGLAADKVYWANQRNPVPSDMFILLNVNAIETIGQDFTTYRDNSFTFSDRLCTPNHSVDQLTSVSAHGFASGDGPVRLTGATLPTGLDDETDYWIIHLSSTVVQLATTFPHAVSESNPVTFSDNGSGSLRIVDTANTLKVGLEQERHVHGDRVLTVSVQCFNATPLGIFSAYATLSRIIAFGSKPERVSALNDAGLGMLGHPAVRTFGVVSNSAVFEPRAIFEARFSLSEDVFATGSIIEYAKLEDENTEESFYVPENPLA